MTKTFFQMTNAEVKQAARAIIVSSTSEEEVRRRITDELGCPYHIALTSCLPKDEVGREARSIVRALGGLVMKNGAMAMAMMHGPDGKTISI